MLFILIALHVAGVSSHALDPDKEDLRRIEVKSLGFAIDMPSHWELTLSERARRFITIGETDERGNRKSASLNIIYREAKEQRFPPMPDAEAYAEISSKLR